jgi:hypothetical protein
MLSEFSFRIANSSCLKFHELRLPHPGLCLMELAAYTQLSIVATLFELVWTRKWPFRLRVFANKFRKWNLRNRCNVIQLQFHQTFWNSMTLQSSLRFQFRNLPAMTLHFKHLFPVRNLLQINLLSQCLILHSSFSIVCWVPCLSDQVRESLIRTFDLIGYYMIESTLASAPLSEIELLRIATQPRSFRIWMLQLLQLLALTDRAGFFKSGLQEIVIPSSVEH